MGIAAVLICLVAGFSFLVGRQSAKDAGKKMLKKWIEDHGCFTCQEHYEEQCLTPEEWDHI